MGVHRPVLTSKGSDALVGAGVSATLGGPGDFSRCSHSTESQPPINGVPVRGTGVRHSPV